MLTWDQNGEITDPPAFTPTRNFKHVQYAQPIRPVLAPTFSTAEEPLFCATCLKNQLILTESLAQYLPPPSDPEYESREADLPGHRERLEEKWPQVCEDCEPRVLARIRKAGYAAKTDHLRRMMERSRRTGVRKAEHLWNPWGLIQILGHSCWMLGLACQILWDIWSVLFIQDESVTLGLSDNTSLWQFSRDAVTDESTLGSVLRSTSLGGYGLLLSGISIWWLPQNVYKAKSAKGRVRGIIDYYKVQVISFGARLLLWLLADDYLTRFDASSQKGIHLVMIIFTSLVRCSRVSYCSHAYTMIDC